MRICIFGAGAIGGYMGAKLAAAGADVSLVARGPHLAAMQARGLTLIEEGGTRTVPVRAASDPAALGPQDYVIVTLKAHSVPAVVPQLSRLLGAEGTLVSGVNGLPWWYFHRHGGPLEGRRLESVDPGGVQWDGLGPDRVLGCVVYPAAEVVEPGAVRHLEGNRFSLGEPSGEKSDRALRLSEALTAAGLKAPVRPRLRDEIWVKLWGNLSFNPISALTGATLDRLCTDPGTRAVARSMMLEAQAIAERLGGQVSHRCGAPHRRGRSRRCAPDVDAAGSRSRAADGDRGAGGVRGGTWPHREPADAHHRHGAGNGAAPGKGGGSDLSAWPVGCGKAGGSAPGPPGYLGQNERARGASDPRVPGRGLPREDVSRRTDLLCPGGPGEAGGSRARAAGLGPRHGRLGWSARHSLPIFTLEKYPRGVRGADSPPAFAQAPSARSRYSSTLSR